MTVSVWQDRSEAEQIKCDVLVIGAGIVGGYLASLLADAGMSVAVVDAREVAGGATGRNAGMLLTGLAEHYSRALETYGVERAREAWQLTVENRERSRALAERLDVPFQRCGSLLLAVSEAEAEELNRSAEMLQEHGFRAGYEPRDPLNRGFVAALDQPDDAVIDPVRLTEAILTESGAQIYEHSEVFSIESEAQGLLVRSRRATFHPQFCVLAINGYAPLLEPYFVDRVTPTRGQILLTAPAPPIVDVACYADHGYEYFRQLADGRFLMGGFRQHYRADELGYSDETTEPVQAGLERFLAERFPEVVDRITHRWSGVMGFSRDGLPLVGSLPRDPRIFFAVGFTGHGLGLGLVAAERLVALLQDGKDPGIFSARRLD